MHNGSLSDDDRGLPPLALCALYAWRVQRGRDGLRSYSYVAKISG